MSRIRTVEMHTAGEPLRIVVSGYPTLKGTTALEKMKSAEEQFDHLRKMLILEPRGHRAMYGAVLVPPSDARAQLSVFFMHNQSYATMCGHAVISLARFAVDYGYATPVEPETRVNIECPCGLVQSYVECKDGKTGDARYQSVLGFVFQTDLEVEVSDLGKVNVDIAYGGSFYVIVRDSELGVNLSTTPLHVIGDRAIRVCDRVKQIVSVAHPENDSLSYLVGTIVTDGKDDWSETEPTSSLAIVGDKSSDRSPCGSGLTARLALQYHRGQIAVSQERVFLNSKTNSKFTGRIISESPIGRFKGVVVEVGGRGHYIGEATYILEENDEYGKGFLVD